MEKSPAKLNINIQLVIIIVLVFFCGVLFILKSSEKAKREQVQTKLIETLNAKKELEKNIEELKNLKNENEAKISNLEVEIKKLAESLNKEKEEKSVLKSNLDAKEAMLGELNAQLDREKGEKQSLSERLARSQKEFDALKSQADQLAKIKGELEKKIIELAGTETTSAKKGEVELEKIVVSSESKLKGDVLVVNKNLGFVVTNLGSKNGITPGTILGIYRSESFLGEVQVEKVYESISSANILPEWKSVEFKEGDKAIIME